MITFCPKCGSKNKSETAFCRNCGEVLPKIEETKIIKNHLKKIKHLNTSSFILSAVLSLLCSSFAIYLMINKITESDFILWIFIALSVILIGLSMLSIYGNFYLKKTDFDSEKNYKHKSLTSSETKEFLPEPDFSDMIPPSVTEKTTRKLDEEILTKK